jgi:hypothetical protein
MDLVGSGCLLSLVEILNSSTNNNNNSVPSAGSGNSNDVQITKFVSSVLANLSANGIKGIV